MAFELEWVSIECRKTKTKVITLPNQKGRRQSSKPIKTVADTKRGKMCTRGPRLVLVSLLIGWKSGVRTLNQSSRKSTKKPKQFGNYFQHSIENRSTTYQIWLRHLVTWILTVPVNAVLAPSEEISFSSLPVDIPDLTCVVHGARSQKVPAGMPRTPPHRMGVVSEGKHAFRFGKIPDFDRRISRWCGQTGTPGQSSDLVREESDYICLLGREI